MIVTGKLDYSLSTPTTKLYTNINPGKYYIEAVSNNFTDVQNGSTVFLDIDNDGDEDVIISGEDQNGNKTTKIYRNDNLGSFTFINTLEGVVYGSIAFSDIDNDGDNDVLITGNNSTNQTIANLYANNGSGSFTLMSQTFIGVHSGEIVFSDLDNDGDDDVLITGMQANGVATLCLYTNDGLGNFNSTPWSVNFFEGVIRGFLGVSDVDGDGDKDIVIVGYDGYNSSATSVTKIYVNDGFGVFSVDNSIYIYNYAAGGYSYCSGELSDIDNDGDEDLLLTGLFQNNRTTRLYLNNGLGFFSYAPGDPFIGVYHGSVAFTDFDNDGDDDVLITGIDEFNNFSINLYKNLYHLGCTDLMACNYDATAALDDSSCVYSNTSNDSVLACNSYLWNGITFTQSATYDSTFTNTNGCDSVATLVVTINNATTSTDVQTACSNYTWIDGVIYTTSNNTATYTTINSVGCDSVITLNLTIYNNSSTTTEVSCDTCLWNGITYTQSGTYDSTFTNTNGCDSVAFLVLTINNATTSTDVQTACDTYTWIDGLIYTASNSTATYTTVNSVGCDNVATLNLTITGFPTAVITQNGIDLSVTSATSYLWNTTETTQALTPNANGWYWCIITDANGCISDTAFYEVTNIVSAINETLSDKIFIYPNPTKDYLVIETEYIITEVKVIDAQARAVDVLVKGKTIDVSGIANGLYFVEVYTDKGLVRKQFVKN